MKNHYGGSYDDGTTVNVSVDVKIYDKNDLSYTATNRHNIFIVNQCTDWTKAGMAEEGGKNMELSLAVCDNINGRRVSNMSNTFERTVAHEFGHFLNLAHDEINNNNLMNPKTEGNLVTSEQIHTALSNFRSNKINQGNGFFYYQQRMRRRNSLGAPPHKK